MSGHFTYSDLTVCSNTYFNIIMALKKIIMGRPQKQYCKNNPNKVTLVTICERALIYGQILFSGFDWSLQTSSLQLPLGDYAFLGNFSSNTRVTLFLQVKHILSFLLLLNL